MPYSLRDYAPDDKLCQHLYPDVFAQIIPLETICEVLSTCQAWQEREQKLNMVSIISLLIAMGLFPRLSIADALYKLAQGTRFVWADPGIEVAGPNAVSYRRQQLGILPLRRLFETVCRPRATPETPGAFRFGYHLMALDSTLENVPDTPANDAVFDRTSSNHGQSAFPQVRGTYLLECGTHLLVDAVFAPCRPSEQLSAPLLLPRLSRGMLLLLDRGFHSGKLFCAIRQTGAQVLGRLSASAILHYERQLADGTYLAWLYPDDAQGHQRGKPMPVRVIEYRIDDPIRNPTGETHRLVTSLLNPRTAPALELIDLYHERWEIELAIDELDTHQRLCQRTLRSLTPEGVIQELYGLLLGYYAVRALMLEAALQAGLDSDRLSFTHAITLITSALPEFQMVVTSQHERLQQRLAHDLSTSLLPPRRLRVNPRVVKSKRAKFPLRHPEHRKPPKPEKAFQDVVVLLTLSEKLPPSASLPAVEPCLVLLN